MFRCLASVFITSRIPYMHAEAVAFWHQDACAQASLYRNWRYTCSASSNTEYLTGCYYSLRQSEGIPPMLTSEGGLSRLEVEESSAV